MGITFAMAMIVAIFGPRDPDLIQMLSMLTPTIGVLLLLLVLTPDGYHRSGWARLAMHRAGWRGWLPALVIPTAILVASYGAAVLVGVAAFDVDADVVLTLLISIMINSAFAVLEEIGWRGYLLPHLSGSHKSAAPAVVGLLHGIWRLPLMLLTTAYNPAGNRFITVPIFLAILTGAGVIYAYLRSMSGSLWPVVIAHGTFNAVLGALDNATDTTNSTAAAYPTGETGIFTLAGVVVAAALLTGRRPSRPINEVRSSEPTHVVTGPSASRRAQLGDHLGGQGALPDLRWVCWVRQRASRQGIMMARIPLVADGLLLGAGDEDPPLAVGSHAWFAWLTGDSVRSFAYRSPAGRYTARKEQRRRGGSYWVAYRTVHGRQHKRYLGKSEDLTSTRLSAVAVALATHIDGAEAPARAGPGRSVLTAKLLVPVLHRGTVTRPRLHELLDGTWDSRLTTVVAPAGWGKTTLAANWARDQPEQRPVAWLSLDEADDDPARFWTYALSAVARVAPDVAGDALAAVGAPSLDPVQLALTSLLERLAATRGEYALVLDDYHVLRDRTIHETVEFLLTYLPPSLHLVLATRADPPLPLARMRARGWLTEIRVTDLRCTAGEGAAMLSAVADVGADATDALVERTEGWPAGLRLAALAVRNAGDPGRAAASIRGDDRQLLDYIDSEVLAGLDPHHRRLLVRCSVLDRLCGPLCDEVLSDEDSAASLEALERAGAFVTEVGEGWYRCHPLFSAALRRELDRRTPADVPDLLVRASGWFLRQGYVEEAVSCLADAGHEAEATRLLVENVRWFIDRGAVAALFRLGERLAPAVPDARLYLLIAGTAGQCGRLERTVAWLEAAEPLIAIDTPPMPGWSSLRAWADTTWAVYGVPEDPEAALRHGRRAADLERDPSQWGYVVARQALAGALRSAGLVREAVDALQEARAAPVHRTLRGLPRLQIAGQLAGNLLDLGDADGSRRVCLEVAQAAAEAERTWGVGAAAAVAIIRRTEGRLLALTDPQAALPLLRRAVALAEDWGHSVAVVEALIGLAEAEWATGDRSGARLSLDRAREAAEEIPRHFAAQRVRELEARIGRGASRAARRRAVLPEELTDRELAVLRALRSPLSARDIGAELYLSINTVKSYKKSLYRKLGVVTREDAVRRGRELGLA